MNQYEMAREKKRELAKIKAGQSEKAGESWNNPQ